MYMSNVNKPIPNKSHHQQVELITKILGPVTADESHGTKASEASCMHIYQRVAGH